MTALNPELVLTLDDAVTEVYSSLFGIDLEFVPEYDKYRSITRHLNKALRKIAIEHEWGYFSSTVSVGTATEGLTEVFLDASVRPRIINDDAVRLVNPDGVVLCWAYFLPRDAGHKYQGRPGLWVTSTRNTLLFTKPLNSAVEGFDIQVPVMREPVMFRLPEAGVEVNDEIREQPVDFDYPDVVIARAAYTYALTDPVLQPRAQTLEAEFKDLMYQAMERNDRNTDSPFLNEFIVPVDASPFDTGYLPHLHPHSSWNG